MGNWLSNQGACGAVFCVFVGAVIGKFWVGRRAKIDMKPHWSSGTRELTSPVDLCDTNGDLNFNAIGWSRKPLHRCNLSGHRLRKKRWNFWCLTGEHFLFSITFVNVDYLHLVIVHMYDRRTKASHEETWIGKAEIPDYPEASLSYSCRSLNVLVERKVVVRDGLPATGGYAVQLRTSKFGGNVLNVDAHVLVPPGHESLGVVIPWSPEYFHYTSKQNAMPATGKVRWGSTEYELGPDAYGSLDFGRGVWRYESFWTWASMSARVGKNVVGINFGGKWTDGSGSTENAICVNGQLTKFNEDIEFRYDPKDKMKPWRLCSVKTKAVDLTFTPQYDHVATINLVAVKSEMHRLLGFFSGTLRTQDDEEVPVRDAFGCLEEHMARW